MRLWALALLGLAGAEEWAVEGGGYLFFCLCMGRFGNQMEHLLGGMAFARALNRTLVIPPLRTYVHFTPALFIPSPKNVEYSEWFDAEALGKYHRTILAGDFMREMAERAWPMGKRLGFCYQAPKAGDLCVLKSGNPFANFWDELGVDFVDHVRHSLSAQHPHLWRAEFPPERYPVIAMRGAPASFPMVKEHLEFQRYIRFSQSVAREARQILRDLFGRADVDYVGIHIRNGTDWTKACAHLEQYQSKSFMVEASYQCQGWDYQRPLTFQMCFNSIDAVLAATVDAVHRTNVKGVLIGTDSVGEVVGELERAMPGVRVVHSGASPILDAYLLAHSTHFVGNCVSSFSAFIWRYRAAQDLGPTSHFSIPAPKPNTDEL